MACPEITTPPAPRRRVPADRSRLGRHSRQDRRFGRRQSNPGNPKGRFAMSAPNQVATRGLGNGQKPTTAEVGTTNSESRRRGHRKLLRLYGPLPGVSEPSAASLSAICQHAPDPLVHSDVGSEYIPVRSCRAYSRTRRMKMERTGHEYRSCRLAMGRRR